MVYPYDRVAIIQIIETNQFDLARVLEHMRTTTVSLLSLLATLLLTHAPVAEACGGYGPPRHTLDGRIVIERPASDGLDVRATCGDEVFEAEVDEDGRFVLYGLPRGTCTLEATAHECYTWDRKAALRVSLPSETVTIVIPDADA
jgi:hypothetical protein